MSHETEADQSKNNDAVEADDNNVDQAGPVSNEEIEQELLQEQEQNSSSEQLQQQLADANDQVLRIQAEMQKCASSHRARYRECTQVCAG